MRVNASKAVLSRQGTTSSRQCLSVRPVGAGGLQKPPPTLWLQGADGAIVAFRAGRTPL